MVEGMRHLVREGLEWSVREASGARVPGARGSHCLIFDGETIVRRVWIYPAAWSQLDDDGLWALLGPEQGPARPVMPSSGQRSTPSSDPAFALAAETIARAKALGAQIVLLREANQSLRRETTTLIAACRERRDSMRCSIEAYAAAMRLEGVLPEDALVLIKFAVREGLGPVRVVDDLEAEKVLADAVEWGIGAYYAA
jgi:hypothetical protein